MGFTIPSWLWDAGFGLSVAGALISLGFFVAGWYRIPKRQIKAAEWTLMLAGLALIGSGFGAMFGYLQFDFLPAPQLQYAITAAPIGSLITLFGMLNPVKYEVLFK